MNLADSLRNNYKGPLEKQPTSDLEKSLRMIVWGIQNYLKAYSENNRSISGFYNPGGYGGDPEILTHHIGIFL